MTEWPPYSKPFLTSPPDGSVGIALPIRDDLRFFKLCFHSLIAFADWRFMLTVVDNMSGIKTVQYLESLRRNHNINVLRYQAEHNLAAEWNLALRYMFAHTTVKYGMVLTPTIVFEPFCLSGSIRSIEQSSSIGIVAPATEREEQDFILFKRSAYEHLGGFNEGAIDPVKDFMRRWVREADHSTSISPVYVHKFRINGFDPRLDERDLVETTQEAQRART